MVKNSSDMDEKDLQILSILQSDARATNAAVARRLGIAPSAVLERIRKLERRGVILGYEVRLAPSAVSQGILAFVSVLAEERPGEESTARLLARIPEIQEVHQVAGEDCYLIKLRCASTDALGQLLKGAIGAIPSVRRTKTTIVLSTEKESAQLKLPGAAEGDAA